jgi:hypothetical protein
MGVFDGLGVAKKIKFLPHERMEHFDPAHPEENNAITVRNLLRVLFMGSEESILSILSYDVVRAVMHKRNPVLLNLMKEEFKQGFEYIFTQISRKENPIHPEQARLYLSNCLNILPFSNIEEGDVFDIPAWIDGEWKQVAYRVKPIELTDPNANLTSAKRVFAHALNPIDCPEAEAHLIFKGTTYFADDGFISQVESDFKPNQTPGQDLYETGHKRLEAWLDAQSKKIHVCGMSLGGSLALLFAMHRGDKIRRVDALNPGGLYSLLKKDNVFNCWDELEEKPEVMIQKQGNDPVSAIGFWLNAWFVIEVIPLHKARMNWLDHSLIYTGLEGTQFRQVDVIEDNKQRAAYTDLIYSKGRGCLDVTCIQPVQYIKNHRIKVLFTGISLALFCALQPQLLVFMALPWIVQALMFSVVSGHVLSEVGFFAMDGYQGEQKGQFSRALSWVGEQSTITQGAIALAGLSLVLLPVMYPAMALSLSFLIAAISCILDMMQGVANYGPRMCGVMN